DGQRRDEDETSATAAQQQHTQDVGRHRRGLAAEVEPGPRLVALEQPAVARQERRARGPDGSDADRDAGERQQPCGEREGGPRRAVTRQAAVAAASEAAEAPSAGAASVSSEEVAVVVASP